MKQFMSCRGANAAPLLSIDMVCAGGSVFNEQKDEVLLIQSKRYTVMRLEWEIPAGRVEEGESKEDAGVAFCICVLQAP